MMLLAKHGGGVGVGLNMIRRVSNITQNGTSDGVVPCTKPILQSLPNQGSKKKTHLLTLT